MKFWEKRSQASVELVLVYFFAILAVLAMLSSFGFLFSGYSDSVKNLFGSFKSISGNVVISSDVIEIPSEVSPGSELLIKVHPGKKGVYNFGYIYDSSNKSRKVFSFGCDDVCEDDSSASVLIDENFSLGNYSVLVFDYTADDYARKDFSVVSGLASECKLNRAYWERENAKDSENVNLILESEGCEGKTAVFSIYEKNLLFDSFVENVSGTITGNKLVVSWNAEHGSSWYSFVYNPASQYYFKVKVNPEIESENILSVSGAEVEGKIGLEELDEESQNIYKLSQLSPKDPEYNFFNYFIPSRDSFDNQWIGYAPGEVLVKIKEQASINSVLKSAKAINLNGDMVSLGTSESERLLPTDGFDNFEQAYQGMQEEEKSLYRIYRIKLPQDVSVENATVSLAENPDIEFAQPDYLMQLYMNPNDPFYHSSGSWQQNYDDLYALKEDKLESEPAWNLSQGENVVVAVLDTGVDYNHADISSNIWTNQRELTGQTGVDDDWNGFVDDIRGWDFSGNTEVYDPALAQPDNNPTDYFGHGTHVAGTIAATGNNNLGIIGVAPKAKIMPLKIFPNAYTSVAVNAIKYAADSNASILSNSWGPGERTPSDPVLESIIDYAYSKGKIIVFAAGNSYDDVAYYSPANYAKSIAVSATDQNDKRVGFSNYGDLIAVSAPGANILSLKAAGTDMYGDGAHIVQSNYIYASGTSMAAPHVSGLIALLKSAEPNLTQEQIRERITSLADDLGEPGKDIYFGAGRINSGKTLFFDNIDYNVAITSPIYNSYLKGAIDIQGSTYISQGFQKYGLYYALKNNTEEQTLIASSSSSVSDGLLGNWNTLNVPDGDYVLILKAIHESGVSVKDYLDVKVDNVNDAPVFIPIDDMGIVVNRYVSEPYELKVEATDQDDPATPEGQIVYSVVGSLPAGASFNPSAQIFSWKLKGNETGTYTVTFKVADNQNEALEEARFNSVFIKKRLLHWVNEEWVSGYPDIYGDTIAWLWEKELGVVGGLPSVNYKILMCNMTKSGQAGGCFQNDTKTVIHDWGVQTRMFPPVIYGDKIIYEKPYPIDQDFPHRSPLLLYDIKTGQETTLPIASTYPYDIYEDKIVTSEQNMVGPKLYVDVVLYDLTKQQKTYITKWFEVNKSTQCGKPQIHENRIVYTCYDWDTHKNALYLYDLETAQTTKIIDVDFSGKFLDFYGDKLLWQRVTSRTVDGWTTPDARIVLYDIKTKEEKTIGVKQGQFGYNWWWAYDDAKFDAYDGKEVIMDLGKTILGGWGGAFNTLVELYDIETGQSTFVITEELEKYLTTPQLYKDTTAFFWGNYPWGVYTAKKIYTPIINSVTPSSFNTGGIIAIGGANFGEAKLDSEAEFFNNAACDIENWADNLITCRVPEWAQSGFLTIFREETARSNGINVNVLNEKCYDVDSDGYGRAGSNLALCSLSASLPDCDDNNSLVNPGVTEICNDNTDNDCDGKADCDDSDCYKISPSCPACHLTEAHWSKTIALAGEQVSMTVKGENCYADIPKEMKFEVRKLSDNSLARIQPNNSDIGFSKAETTWISEYNLTEGPQDYYFTASSIGDSQATIDSRNNEEGILEVYKIFTTDTYISNGLNGNKAWFSTQPYAFNLKNPGLNIFTEYGGREYSSSDYRNVFSADEKYANYSCTDKGAITTGYDFETSFHVFNIKQNLSDIESVKVYLKAKEVGQFLAYSGATAFYFDFKANLWKKLDETDYDMNRQEIEIMFRKDDISDDIFGRITNSTLPGISTSGRYFVLAIQAFSDFSVYRRLCSGFFKIGVDYVELKVNSLNGTSQLESVELNLSSNNTNLGTGFEMSCTPQTGKGAGTGVDMQFSKDGANWYAIAKPRNYDALGPAASEVPSINSPFMFNREIDKEKMADFKASLKYAPSPVSGNIYEYSFESRFNYFYTYNQTLEFLQEMQGKYPDVAKLYSIGKSYEGRDIWALKISDNVLQEEQEPEALIVSGTLPGFALNKHILLYNVWQLLEDYSRGEGYVKTLVEERQVWIVPMLNPDAVDCNYAYNDPTQARFDSMCYDDKLGSKNKDGCTASGCGVNLDTNLDYKWAFDDVCSAPASNPSVFSYWIGQSEYKFYTYRGTSAFSEPETLAVKSLIDSRNFSFFLQYDYSNSGGYPDGSGSIIYPWAYNETEGLLNAEKYLDVALAFKKSLTQYPVTFRINKACRNGDLIDYMQGRENAMSFLITGHVVYEPLARIFYAASLPIYLKPHYNVFLNSIELAGDEVKMPLIDEESAGEEMSIDVSDNHQYSRDIYANEEGDYYLRCRMYNNTEETYSSVETFKVRKPELKVDQLAPTIDTSVEKGKSFEFSVNVSCSGGECGQVDVYLDPEENGKKQISVEDSDTGYIVEFVDETIIGAISTKKEKQSLIEKRIESQDRFGAASVEELNASLITLEQEIKSDIKKQAGKIKSTHEKFKKDFKAIIKQSNQLEFSAQAVTDELTGKIILGEYSKTFNGIALNVSKKEAEKLLSLDYVRAVYPNKEYQLLLDETIDWLGIDDIWNFPAPGNQKLTGKGIKIAMIDTGVKISHEMFGNDRNPVFKKCYSFDDCLKVLDSWDFVFGDNQPWDENGHGTHTASTAAGIDDGVLRGGMAPDAQLYIYKVCYGTGCYTAYMIAAIERAVDPNNDLDFSDRADIISMSIGGFGHPDSDPTSKSIDYASEIGTISFLSAGNAGSYGNYTINCPACARTAIAVAAACKPEQAGTHFQCKGGPIADFSSRGPGVFGWNGIANEYLDLQKPEIAAPGVWICAARKEGYAGSEGYPTCIDDNHVRISGTSMAAPHAAGIGALIVQANPGITWQEMEQMLQGTAIDLGESYNAQGAGLINPLGALEGPFYNYIRIEPDPVPLSKTSRCVADVFGIENSNIVSVKFNITDSEGNVIMNNIQGSREGNVWTSPEFIPDKGGEWICEITVEDQLARIIKGSITFVPGRKGLVPTEPSEPFFTTSENPKRINLSEGQAKKVSWTVHTTGLAGSVYEFYAYAVSLAAWYLTDTGRSLNLTIFETCTDGQERVCGLGVCTAVNETCVNQRWPGCNLDLIPNYEPSEASCSDSLDNDCDNFADCNDSGCSSASECKIPCALNYAAWGKSSAVLGEQVSLNAQGSSCAQREINFTIMKNIPFWFDKKMFTNSAYGFTTWEAGKNQSGSFETGNFYFIATISDNASLSVSSQDNGGIDLAVSAPIVDQCSDGTVYGNCSATKPKYCKNGVLINNCSFCGCDYGNCLANGSCELTAVVIHGFSCDEGDNITTCNITNSHYIDDGTLIGANNLVIKSGGALLNDTINCSGTSHGCGFQIALTGDLIVMPRGNIAGGNISISASNVDIWSGGKISTDGLGWMNGLGPGGRGAAEGGASYGGLSRTATSWASTYGSATAPADFGSGGYSAAGGGGIVFINVSGDVNISGNLGASGVYSYYGGSSGGSVWIISNSISGTGNITANGGRGSYRPGGGGGRVRTTYAVNNFTGIISVSGGPYDTGISHHGTYSFPDNSNLAVKGNMALAGGTYNIPYLNITNNAALEVQPVNATASGNGAGVVINSINVNIDSGAKIDGGGLGFEAKKGPGYQSYYGGSYGGQGGGQTNLSKTYGSETWPVSLGSGGSGEAVFGLDGVGGGAIFLNATGNIGINGNINTDGSYAYYGGGSGGSVLIAANNIFGNGILSSSGGSGSWRGGGGGGRIALHAATINLPSEIENKGGTQGIAGSAGSAGSIYINATTSITGSGKITAAGYNGTNARISFISPFMTLRGVYNATGNVSNGSIILNYNDCSSDVSSGIFSPPPVYQANCEAGAPVSILSYPEDNYASDSGTVIFECNATDNYGVLVNTTLYIWNSTGSEIKKETKQISGTKNSTTFNHEFGSYDTYKWNCLVYNNNSASAFSFANRTLDYFLTAPCTLTGASWNQTSAVQGQTVKLNVNGTNCNGKEINFTIMKSVLFWFDKKMFATSAFGFTIWEAGKNQSGSFDTGNFYFISEVSDGGSEATSNSLSVSAAPPVCVDADGDKYNVSATGCGLADCDDGNSSIHPNAVEICNGADDNCVSGIDENNGNCGGNTPFCSAGKCIECLNDNQCLDNVYCNAIKTCNNGVCIAGNLPSGSDGVSCTIDTCDEANDNVSHVPNNLVCDDGAWCNGQETCSALTGCLAGIPPSGSDFVSCTIDSCSEAIDGFIHTPNNSACNDGKYCTIDSCSVVDNCAYSARDCSDANSGTYDFCNETTNRCENMTIVNDEDKDGVPDEIDKCPGTPLSVVLVVNKYGCPMPIAVNFDIMTDLTNADLGNVSDFEIGISSFGKIQYSGKNLTLIKKVSVSGSNFSRIDFDSNINISQYRIELNSQNILEMNKSAEITFFNVSFVLPVILTDGKNCFECIVKFWNETVRRIVFSVPHFTSYEVVEGYSSCGNLSCDAGETCSNCPADCGGCGGNDGGGDNGGGGGGGGGGTPLRVCNEDWACSGWSECTDDVQSRTCADKNNCSTSANKPETRQSCIEIIGAGNETGRIDIGNVVESIRLNWKLIVFIAGIALVGGLIVIVIVARKVRERRAIERIRGKN